MKHLSAVEMGDIAQTAVKAALDQVPDDVSECCVDGIVLTIAAALVGAAIHRTGEPIQTMRTFTGLLNQASGRPIAGVAVIHGGALEEPLPTTKAN
jgi:hypothetical protein